MKHTSEHKLFAKIEDMKSKGEHADIIIVGDTVISYGDEIIEKAKDEQDAIDICTKLTGNTHYVLTSVFIAVMDEDMNVKHMGDGNKRGKDMWRV